MLKSNCLGLYDVALCNVYKVSSILKFQSCYNRCLKCFYRSMLSIRGTSHGPMSVRLSVCRSSIKTVERIKLDFGMWASFHRPTLC